VCANVTRTDRQIWRGGSHAELCSVDRVDGLTGAADVDVGRNPAAK
jgi:hypothetical protein